MTLTSSPVHISQIANLDFLTDPKAKSWWAALWRGLVVDRSAKHYKAMRSAIWLYMYLVLHADRSTGILTRKIATMAKDMQVNPRTVQYWLSRLRKTKYVTVRNSGRALEIHIQKWKPLRTTQIKRKSNAIMKGA